LTNYSGVGSLADYYLDNTFSPSTPAAAAVGISASAVVWYGEMNEITAENKLPPIACPACGCKPNLYRFGVKKQLFMDLPTHAKRVGITLHRQRYRCRECNVTFLEPLADMDEKWLATKRLVNPVSQKHLRQHRRGRGP